MSDHDVFDSNDPGDAEVERRLRAYADERLSPSAAATTRMRAGVMGAAHRRAALMAADATLAAAGTTETALADSRARRTGGGWRRPVAAVLAGCLVLGILAGTALAARPGGPLYAARMWTEMAALPGDLAARAEAEVDRLEARLDEAQQASAAGDAAAVKAALEAYSSILAEAVEGSRDDPRATAAIEVTVTRHLVVLTALADRVPGPAQAAMQRALSASSKALDDIDQKPPQGTDTGGPNDPVGRPTDKPGKPTPGGGGGPAATPRPDKPGQSSDPPGNTNHPEPSNRR